MEDYKTLWKQTLAVVKISISSATLSTWFPQTFISNIKISHPGRQIIEIGCPSSYIRDTLEKRYFGLIQDSLKQITRKDNDVVFLVKQNPNFKTPIKSLPGLLFNQNSDNYELENKLIKSGLPKGFTFENFAVSPTNQLAWAAANAVVKNPGVSYNPLFIWGGVGVGKTHLTIAIAWEIIKKNSDIRLIYCTGEEFMVGIIDAIRNKTTNEFKKRYRNIDVLLVDDIQFIAGKDTLQDEFFHTFNVLQRSGGQIIVTSDRPPSEVTKLTDRLKNRFEAGLIVDIAKPDFELRCAILMIKAKNKGIDLSIDNIELIANDITSPRGLEGFLIQLQSQFNLINKPITQDLVKYLLNKNQIKFIQNDGQLNGVTKPIKKTSYQEILSCVCNYFSLNKKTIISQNRSKNIAWARQIIMYLLRVELKLPLEEIGQILGGRDHTTIMYGVDKITFEIKKSPEIQQQILIFKNQIWGN